MHRSIFDKLICPVCKSDNDLKLHAFGENDSIIKNGIITCNGCHSWYPIQDQLLEFVIPELQYSADLVAFVSEYKSQLDDLGIQTHKLCGKYDISEQEKQREHYDNFEKEGGISYDDFEKLPFWIANDQSIYNHWKTLQAEKGGWLLDVGCGNGRSAERLAANHLNVIGIDISKAMLRKAINRAKENGKIAHQTFMVGDATNLPFKNESFNYSITSGVLSQLPNTQKTCNEIQRILRNKGVYFGLENNKSIFRGIFDLLNKIIAIWKNKKGKEPEISHSMLERWHQNHKVNVQSYTSVFLPPNFFNQSVETAINKIESTNKLFYSLGFKNHGGLIIFEIIKN